ncbi:MAG: transposase family protein [Deltaproteobacteria bacterium]|nr:transposase family protein [Deltaproteobacteria bacterium]
MRKMIRRRQAEQVKRLKRLRRQARMELKESQDREGLSCSNRETPSNCKSSFQTVEEERAERQEAVGDYLLVLRRILPDIVEMFSKVPDFRNPRKIKHKIAVLLMFGLLTFVFQKASRREANRELTTATFLENLQILFPDIEALPHHDTLNRVLTVIDVNEIEKIQADMIKKFIKSKKFVNYLIDNCYPIAIDGTQKLSYNFLWAEECQEWSYQEKKRYSCYVLEASLAFHNGMVLPLATEVLSYMEGDEGSDKQDCETEAFKRLAKRIKGYFPKLKVMVLLDGLYPNGPIIELCRKYRWQFMMVLKDDSLPSVWEEVEGLKILETDNHLRRKWGNRIQHFWWVNHIDYFYDNDKKTQQVHVVVCEENWEEISKDSDAIVEKTLKHAWISSEPLTRWNVHERCNLGARYRWGIEGEFLVEKRHGYQYEHAFSFNWNAMKGYHLLMRLAHFINVFAEHTELLIGRFLHVGVKAFIKFLDETIRGPWLDHEWLKKKLREPYQMRMA